MSGTLRDLDILAYQLRLSNVVADDGQAYDRLTTVLWQAAPRREVEPIELAVTTLSVLPALCKEKRRREGLSVRAAGELAGVTACTVSRFERGHDLMLSNAVKLITWVGGVEPLDLNSEVAS
jgi:hypothetical protein